MARLSSMLGTLRPMLYAFCGRTARARVGDDAKLKFTIYSLVD